MKYFYQRQIEKKQDILEIFFQQNLKYLRC